MKIFHRTVAVFVFPIFSIALANPVFAEPSENNAKIKVEAQIDEDNEVEFYDYHSGVTYSRTLYHYVVRHLDQDVIKPDKKHTESTNQ